MHILVCFLLFAMLDVSRMATGSFGLDLYFNGWFQCDLLLVKLKI